MPVVNQTKKIPHMGEAFTAFGDKDRCWTAKVGQGVVKSYQNSAYSTDLTAGKTTKTKIENNWIALEGTHWGPPSTSAGGDGATSLVEDKEAWVTVGSTNLFIEGKPVARVEDPTKQNRGNSDGAVKPGSISPRAESNEDYAKKKCQLKKWKGTSALGRELGFPTIKKVGDPYYLEIYDTDVVTFDATRVDITQTPPAENPTCESPTEGGKLHTIWAAKARVFPFFQREEKKEDHSVDTFVVPASLGYETWSSSAILKDIAEGNMQEAMTQIARGVLGKVATNDGDVYGPDAGGGLLGPAGGSDHGSSQFREQDYGGDGAGLQRDWAKRTAKNESDLDGKQGGGIGKGSKNPDYFDGDVRTLMYFAWWFIKPPEISVTATACSGSRKATLKVFPNQKVKFKLKVSADGLKKKAKDALEKRKQGQGQEADDAWKDRSQAGNSQAAAESAISDLESKLSAAEAKKAKHGTSKGSGAKSRDKARRRRQQIHQKEVAPLKRQIESQLQGLADAMAKFDKADAHFKKAVSAMQTTKKVLNTCEKIASLADAPLSFKFLVGFSLEVKISYEPTSDRLSAWKYREYTTATMGQKWEFALAIDPLIQISWTVYVSLLTLAAPYIPGLAQALRRFRIFRVDIFFSISMKLVVGFKIIKKEHDDLSGKGFTRIDAHPSMGCVGGVAGVDVVEFRASLPIRGELEFNPPKTRGSLCNMVPKIRITNHYRATLFPDRWYEIEMFSGQINGLRYFYNSDGKVNYELGSLPA